MFQKIEPEIDFMKGNVLVPSKALKYKKDKEGNIIDTTKPNVKKFEESLKKELRDLLKDIDIFPIKKNIVMTITHGLHSKKEYKNLDLDNRAKTICDALEGAVYQNDNQVNVLLCNKIFLKNTSESYFRFTVKSIDKKVNDYIQEVFNSFRHSKQSKSRD